ncbi:low molecular weight phosphatase family protein [uncultured Aureimonas sp.]|uniref:arsenate-mycothiol transferase ArsC n=1 Tax=uncultured Aureimonas sp. TaxID=1604662 RepID=UPI0025D18DBD|nr:low molecular weight phosphatase family protein [uncultured Aureimonas sp.]
MSETGGSAKRPGSILFVCGMNAIRSPMAEAVARSVLPGTYVASAGVKDGERDPFVDVILAEEGLSLGDRKPQKYEDLADGFFDLIVTLSPEAHHAAMSATEADATAVEFWPMPDPSAVTGSRGQILDAYRDLFRRIKARLDEFGRR